MRRFVVATLAVALAATAGCSSGSKSSSTRTTRKATTITTTTKPPLSTTTVSPSTTATVRGDVLAPPLLSLFPFQTVQEVQAWQQSYRSGGQQPWHLDAGATALAFAQFLGYIEVDKVVATSTDAKGAHVSVGSVVPDTNRLTTAAIVHLVRYGTGGDAPWEVVGTDDTSFSLTLPAYGSTITSPLKVGGRISGVDESIKVHVQQLHANGYLGEFCCVPAGGTSSPWSAKMTFFPTTDPVLMVSASTGGHTRNVERFTVTGVKAAGH
jgi:hypothetical protein